MSTHRPKTNDLLTQREYADRIGVDNSYVSRRTKNGA
jgi:transcriptional regulator with XRE-family HTH domain